MVMSLKSTSDTVAIAAHVNVRVTARADDRKKVRLVGSPLFPGVNVPLIVWLPPRNITVTPVEALEANVRFLNVFTPLMVKYVMLVFVNETS
jgi:hypothetical protein